MISIDPYALYTAGDLEGIFGRHTLALLRRSGGLAAVGDRYSGESVLAVLAGFRIIGRVSALRAERRWMTGMGAKIRWEKVFSGEEFYLHRAVEMPGLWSVSWMSSTTLRYMRRRFRARSLEAAVRMAPRVIGSKGLRLMDSGRFTLADAFNVTVRASRRSERSRRDWRSAVERFIEWLAANRPKTLFWDVVSRQAVRDYLDDLERGRLSTNSRRLAVQPLIQTSKFMMREHGAENDLAGLSPGNALARPPAAVFLADVVDLLEWLKAHRPAHEVGTALCGLAGLRVSEALSLRWDRVDLKNGLIQVVEGKNDYSNRTIPVARRVLEALERAKAAPALGGVVDVYGYVVLDGDGKPFRGHTPYGRRFVRGLRRWNAEISWAPKDLRKCLPTFSVAEGFWGAAVEQYLGHAASGITAKHYVPRLATASDGERGALEDAMSVFRRQVVNHVDRAVDAALSKIEEKERERAADVDG